MGTAREELGENKDLKGGKEEKKKKSKGRGPRKMRLAANFSGNLE